MQFISPISIRACSSISAPQALHLPRTDLVGLDLSFSRQIEVLRHKKAPAFARALDLCLCTLPGDKSPVLPRRVHHAHDVCLRGSVCEHGLDEQGKFRALLSENLAGIWNDRARLGDGAGSTSHR